MNSREHKIGKMDLSGLALANAESIMKIGILMPDEYIKETYGSEMGMLAVTNGYVNLANRILDMDIPDNGTCTLTPVKAEQTPCYLDSPCPYQNADIQIKDDHNVIEHFKQPMSQIDIELKALEKYGNTQVVVAIEELSELQKELTKYLRGNLNTEHLIEEIADCIIMIDQMILKFNVGGMGSKLQDYINVKLERLKERMAKEDENK